MDIRAAEISAILKEQIRNFGREAEVTEVGQQGPAAANDCLAPSGMGLWWP